ncbi:MAG TPA: hypothetical protein VMV49_02605 [Candidatus Deferrimicrobium sp.]|nr:hypothetical protein [Candidatus Deferrimicrobium sp.]
MQKYDYNIPEELFQTIEKEFDGDIIAKKYLESKDASLFETYGKKWMERTYELGTKPENMDRAYEVLKMAAQKTGELLFPHEAQRFIEIAYLSVHLMSGVNIYTANAKELSFQVNDGQCKIYEPLKINLSADELSALPCKHACLTAVNTIFRILKIPVDVSMLSEMSKDGFCSFCANKKYKSSFL